MRSIAVLFLLVGFAAVGCEVWGTYDYLIEKFRRVNYLVAGGVLLTSAAGLLPVAAGLARRQRMWATAVVCWLAVPLTLLFVFTVSIQRTGSAVDGDETERKQVTQNIMIARLEEKEATEQLKIDKAAVSRNCNVWGPICDKAKAEQRATEAKLTAARAVLKKQGIETDDGMATRLVGYLPFLTKQQVLLWQPILLPLCLAVVGSTLIYIAMRLWLQPAAPGPQKASAPEQELEDEPAAPAGLIPAPPASVDAPAPVQLPDNVVPLYGPPEPAQEDAEIDPTPVIRYLRVRMVREANEKAYWDVIYRDCIEWCGQQTPPIHVDKLGQKEFGLVLRHIAEQTRIPIKREGKRPYFPGRKLQG